MGSVEPSPAKWPAQAAYDTESPTGILLDRIADKWTLMIHGTLEAGPMRFSDLRDALGGIFAEGAHAVAARARARRPHRPPGVQAGPAEGRASLTELGGSLCAPVKELRGWAED